MHTPTHKHKLSHRWCGDILCVPQLSPQKVFLSLPILSYDFRFIVHLHLLSHGIPPLSLFGTVAQGLSPSVCNRSCPSAPLSHTFPPCISTAQVNLWVECMKGDFVIPIHRDQVCAQLLAIALSPHVSNPRIRLNSLFLHFRSTFPLSLIPMSLLLLPPRRPPQLCADACSLLRR